MNCLILYMTCDRFNTFRVTIRQFIERTDCLQQSKFIVLNNGQCDKTNALLEKIYTKHNRFGFILMSANVGICPILNIGINKFYNKGDYLVTTDDDNMPLDADWLCEMKSIMDSDRKIGVVLMQTYYDLDDSPIRESDMNILGPIRLFSPEAIDKLKYYSYDYGLYGVEDTDIIRRIHFLGFKIISVSRKKLDGIYGRFDEKGEIHYTDGGINKYVDKGESEAHLGKNFASLRRNTYLYERGINLEEEYDDSYEKYIISIKAPK